MSRKSYTIPGISFIITRPFYTYTTPGGTIAKWIPATGEFMLMMNGSRLFEPEPSTLTKAQTHEIINILTDAPTALKAYYHRLIDEGVER